MSSTVKFSNRLFPVAASQVITFTGKTSSSAETFDVKLTNARDIEDIGDIFFNFSVNFQTKEIVRNSQVNGTWGKEEKIENLLTGGDLNPLKKGEKFKIDINVYPNLFIIFIDDSPFCTFELRKPLNEIQKLIVTGDVETIYGVDHVSKEANELNANQIWRGLIPKSFQPGSVIILTAVPQNDSGSFKVNFRELQKTPILMQLVVEFDETGTQFRFQESSFNDSTSNPNSIFPNKQFKVGLGFSQTEVFVAFNGENAGKFSIKNNEVFEFIRALEILKEEKLSMNVRAVDFLRLSEDDLPNFASLTKNKE